MWNTTCLKNISNLRDFKGSKHAWKHNRSKCHPTRTQAYSLHIDTLMTRAGAQRCHVSLITDCIQPGLSSSRLSGFSPGIHATCLFTRSGDSGGKGTVSTLKSDNLYMEHSRWCNIHNVYRWYQTHPITLIYITKLRYDLTWSGWRRISWLHMKNDEALKLYDCQTLCTITKTSTKE